MTSAVSSDTNENRKKNNTQVVRKYIRWFDAHEHLLLYVKFDARLSIKYDVSEVDFH